MCGIEEVQKPVMVEQYNTYMGGVDKSDQLLSYYGYCHRTVKWWRRAFFHLVDNAIVNAYILYRLSEQSGRKLDHKHFRIELAKQLLGGTDGHTHPPSPPPQCSAPRSPPHRTTFPPRRFHHVQVGGLRNLYVLCALIRRVEERMPQPTNVRTVNYQCVLYHVLNSITLK